MHISNQHAQGVPKNHTKLQHVIQREELGFKMLLTTLFSVNFVSNRFKKIPVFKSNIGWQASLKIMQ
jgi:hypothetical protein